MPKQINSVAVKVVIDVEGDTWSKVRPVAEKIVREKMGDIALKVEAISVERVSKELTKPL